MTLLGEDEVERMGRRLEERGWREKARGKGVEGDERREGRGLISMDIHDG